MKWLPRSTAAARRRVLDFCYDFRTRVGKWFYELLVAIFSGAVGVLVELALFCRIPDFLSDFRTRVIEHKPLKSWRVIKKEMAKEPKRAVEFGHVPGET